MTDAEYRSATQGGNFTTSPSEGEFTGPASEGSLVNPLKVKSLEDLLNLVLKAVVEIGRIILVVMLVWVGFLFVKAQGKPEELATARRALIWTVIGGLILLGAEALSTVIQATGTSLGA